MKLPEAIPKEALEFLTRFGGALASVGEQLAFEWWWNAHPEAREKFPFTRPLPELPMYHDWIVGGISTLEALLGLGMEEDPLELFKDPEAKRLVKEVGKGIREFGEGGILYSAPMLARTTAVNLTPRGSTEGGAPPAARGRVINL